MNSSNELQNNLKKFNKIVIWGLKKRFHTHRYIHKAFYDNAKKLGYNVVWVEDDIKYSTVIKKGDLVIASEVVGRMVPEKKMIDDYKLPIVEGVYYCLHNYKELFTSKINSRFKLNLQVYSNEAESIADIKINQFTYFDSKSRTLFQPWGTNLLYKEFKKPVYNKNKLVFWVGSVWNDKFNRGNINEINELRSALKKCGLKFIKLRFVPNWLNIFLIRISRLSPAISGKFQVDVNYLPCRMFKNISYGQLGISNINKFREVLGKYNIEGKSIEDLIRTSLSLNRKEYTEIVLKQQDLIKKYTYENSINNIIKCYDN